VDFALVEVVDIDVVVVIRFVAMETIPEERVAQERDGAKRKIEEIGERRARTIGAGTGRRRGCCPSTNYISSLYFAV
jgi:hypothetical protein